MVLAVWVFSSVWSPGVKYLTATPELSAEILPVNQPSSKQQICGFQEFLQSVMQEKKSYESLSDFPKALHLFDYSFSSSFFFFFSFFNVS